MALYLSLLLITLWAIGSAAHGDAPPVLPSKEDLRVTDLAQVVPEFGLFEGDMYAGRLPMRNGDRSGEMMFWLFAPDRPTSTDTIQMWVSVS